MRYAKLAVLFLLVACDGPGLADAGLDSGFDAAVPPPRVHEELPAPEALMAGIAEVRLPAPLGIGTMGYGAIDVAPSPTPFVEGFPGTTRVHGTLTFRAVAISRGPAHEVIFVRMDTIGVFQQLREAVLAELRSRTGRELNDSLILAGNHTHSGPGRILMTTGALTILSDEFFPEFYDLMVDTLADVVELALADLAPAELAYAMASTSEAHRDRRCENDALDQLQESPEMPVIGVRRGGQLDAIIASYAYHGTALGIDEHTLSGDMGGVVEHKVAERFDHPVAVLFFNAWGADMAPASVDEAPGTTGPSLPPAYDNLERLGALVADTMIPVVEGLVYTNDLPVRARTYRAPISTEVIGYGPGEFDYRHGGAFCGLGTDGNCVDVARVEGLDGRCLPVSARDNLPKQTMITAGQIGGLHFVTGAGEWSTALAHGVLERVRELAGSDVMFIGYANDYLGYSLGEDDWWQGGYEASGALWGPRQGDYLAARTREAFETYFDQWTEPPWIQPVPTEPFTGYEGYAPYVPEGAVDPGTIEVDVPTTPLSVADVVTFTVRGADPWLGIPVATLEAEDGTVVMRTNGTAVDSESYDLWIDLVPVPAYADVERADSRTFSWAFSFPLSRRTAGSAIPALLGGYRFRVSVPTEVGATEITTGVFTVE